MGDLLSDLDNFWHRAYKRQLTAAGNFVLSFVEISVHFLKTKMGKMKKNKVATEKCLLSIIKQQQLGSCSAMCLSSPYCQHIQYLNDEDILEQNF